MKSSSCVIPIALYRSSATAAGRSLSWSVRVAASLLCMVAITKGYALEIAASPEGPVRTLVEARDAVRAARAAGDLTPARVIFANGDYTLSEAVAFDPQDSDVSYEAAPGAHPRFVGGKKLPAFTKGEDGIWTVQLEPGFRFEGLWVNATRAVRARTPNVDGQGLPTGYILAAGKVQEPLPNIPMHGDAVHTLLRFAPEDVKMLDGLSQAELHEVCMGDYHSWDFYRHRIAGMRAEDGVLQFTGGNARPFFDPEDPQRVHFENFRKALDAQGEWFLSLEGLLSYVPRPGETVETTEAWAPVAEKWITVQGERAPGKAVEKLHFQGIAFVWQGYHLPEEGACLGQADNGLAAAIEVEWANDVVFEKCEMTATMTYAVWFMRGCHGCAVRDSWLHDLGGGAVKIGASFIRGAGPSQSDHISVDNCVIHSGGRYFPASVAVLIFQASDCTVRHCDIADFFYTGISIGWTWGYQPTPCARNLVENCHIHHLGWGVLSDMGAIYTLGSQPGTVIRNCHFHDIGRANYGGWGMYNDEGSTGIVWENNLVHHTQDAGYHQHYGRGNIIRNNIIAFCGDEHVRRSRAEAFLAFAFERNIVLLGEGRLFAKDDKDWNDGRVLLADNVYWRPDGVIPEFAGSSWQDWQSQGRDTDSVVADPLFVDAANGDWTLRPESPALKLGFVPFDWKTAGVEGDEAFRKLGAETFPAMRYGLQKPPSVTAANP